MHVSTSIAPSDPAINSPPVVDEVKIANAIEHAAHLLPAQGPITAFVHHNTLHAFEEEEFDAAVRHGADVLGCQPYLSESDYRAMLANGRIRESDIDAVLLDDLGDRADELLGFLGTRFSLYRTILIHSSHDHTVNHLHWFLNDNDVLNRFHRGVSEGAKQRYLDDTRQWVVRDLRCFYDQNWNDDGSPTSQPTLSAQHVARIQRLFDRLDTRGIESWPIQRWESLSLRLLWNVCRAGVDSVSQHCFRPPVAPFVRHRDWLHALTSEDVDERVNDLLIPFCSAFLDQGFCHWPMPAREHGFISAFDKIFGTGKALTAPWRRELPHELRRVRERQLSPLESIADSLHQLGVEPDELESFLSATLLSLRGFAGMIWQLEQRGDRADRPTRPGTLIEYLAIRLILDRLSLSHAAAAAGFTGELKNFRRWAKSAWNEAATDRQSNPLHTAFRLFELAQQLGWRPRTLANLPESEWRRIVPELQSFSEIERRRIYHLAFERRYRTQTLDAVSIHSQRIRHKEGEAESDSPSRVPKFQIVCCIDDREESFRRHLEEVAPDCETFGAAGFFGIPMYYRGAADARFTPLCPVVIQPVHHVREEVVYSLKRHESKRKRARRTIGTVTHRVHIGSRTLTGGWLGTALLGSLATIPLVARILFPRLTARIRDAVGGFVKPPAVTRLQLERNPQQAPGPDQEELGFTIEEMSQSVERMLRDIGIDQFARIFFVCGHGSSSLNNPHEAAYDCGACAGGRGGPNARAFAQMANDPRVRSRIEEQGLAIPDDTIFVGCYHNTCDDSVTYYDLDAIPTTHQADFEAAADAIDRARRQDAHERCRRFESASRRLNFDDALKHVEARSEDLSQVRPECGHATNALCLVGRRAWNRGLFLDRRAFLQSYDPSQDDEDYSILTRILQAVIPVCAGINLEYYFSFVDSTGYGCGSKLPHNVTSLLGVMNGAGSDLLPGLPWQMVEIHEPVRLLFVVESTPQAIKKIISENDGIRRLCDGNWVQLAVLDAESSKLQIYRDREFVPYRPESDSLASAASSVDWYRGMRDHLEFASIGEEFAAHGS